MYWIAGADGQIKLTDQWTVGGTVAKDNNPIAEYKLASVNTTFKYDEHTSATVELAHSGFDQTANAALATGTVPNESGNAERVDLRESYGPFQAILTAGRTDVGFYNPSATLNGGREEIAARTSYQVDPDLKLSAELIKSVDRNSDAERTAGQVFADYRLSDIFTVEVGVRRSEDKVGSLDGQAVGVNAYTTGYSNTAIGESYAPVQTNGTASTTSNPNLTNSTSVRLRLTAKLGEKSSVYGEYERDVADADKQRYAVGGDYQLFERTRIYAEHEWSTSSSGPYGLSTGALDSMTTIGIANTYMKDGEVFLRIPHARRGRRERCPGGFRCPQSVESGRGRPRHGELRAVRTPSPNSTTVSDHLVADRLDRDARHAQHQQRRRLDHYHHHRERCADRQRHLGNQPRSPPRPAPLVLPPR